MLSEVSDVKRQILYVFTYRWKLKIETETKIERRKNIDTKPMDEEEAILQLELINHDFFAFKNVDEECVSIVYRRKDKGYGIINVK